MKKLSWLLVLLSSLGLALAACGPSRGGSSGSGSGDDDDDDDDGLSDGREDIPCGDVEYWDVWRVPVAAGNAVTLRIDTVAAATTFDPSFNVLFGTSNAYEAAEYIDDADDTFDCTFPPPEYQCPELELELEEDGFLFVEAQIAGDCVGDVAAYVFEVEGADGDFTLLLDDHNDEGGDDDDAADDDNVADDDDAADNDDVVMDDDDAADDDDAVGDDDDDLSGPPRPATP
jgi:hypothetical protein